MSDASSPSTSARKSLTTPTSADRSLSRVSSSSSIMTANSTGLSRTRALKATPANLASAKAAVKKPTMPKNVERELDDDAKAEAAALVEELKEQLRKAETASEDYERQVYLAKARLEEANQEQAKFEEAANAHSERVMVLENENRDLMKIRRDIENQFETDRSMSMREREEAATREEELNSIIKRLKESIATREPRRSMGGEGNLSRNTSFRGRSSPNPEAGLDSPSGRRDSSQNSSKLILHKDKVIEDLRLELAEAQIRLVEVENAGGGRLQELEKVLLETRMSNAKLMEDNESYQFLLQEKTMNGDLHRTGVFANSSPPASDKSATSRSPSRDQMSSLATELEDVELDPPSADHERIRKLEGDVNAQREQNKALTLYINRIITKLLQNETFEALFENGTITGDANPLSAPARGKAPEKELPRPPSSDKDPESAAPSLLQRAGSIFGGRQRPVRPRSYLSGQSASGVNANHETTSPASEPPTFIENKPLPNPIENPYTAPSLPLVPLPRSGSVRQHSHRRSKSDITMTVGVVPHRGPPSAVSNGPLSPPLTSNRQSRQFSGGTIPPPLILEDYAPDHVEDDSAAASSVGLHLPPPPSVTDSGYGDSKPGSEIPDTPSSPQSTAFSTSTDGKPPNSWGGPAIFNRTSSVSGNKMRPLRLVQEKAEADAAAAAANDDRKKAQRGSFMGWFQRPPVNALGAEGRPPSGDGV